ncbi:unnamed protein product [Moneuplotes crassus]|uniref:Uncharacterized protein n=1 Tax=Euplotes crassus TaxID=5936 RepID=A0AAD1XVV9_EUPCR|nr:unnamed protein product [Moneuplotes crassus]
MGSKVSSVFSKKKKPESVKVIGFEDDKIEFLMQEGNKPPACVDCTLIGGNDNSEGVYRGAFEAICEHYEDPNDFFIPNLRTKNNFLFVLFNLGYYKFLEEIIQSDVLEKTLNFEKQHSLLHALALEENIFDSDQRSLFDLLFKKTYIVTKNKLNRSFVETAIAQKSPNLDYIQKNIIVFNPQRIWIFHQVLVEKHGLKKNLLLDVIKKLKQGCFVRERYAKMLQKSKG